MRIRIFRTIASLAGSMVYGGNAGNKNVADKKAGVVRRDRNEPKRPKDGGENKNSR